MSGKQDLNEDKLERGFAHSCPRAGVSCEKGSGGGESGGRCLKKYLVLKVVVASLSRLLSQKAEPL